MTTEKPLLSDINVHYQSGLVVDMVMKTALARRALDNITCVFIGFENWEKSISQQLEKINKQITNSNHRISLSKTLSKISSNPQALPIQNNLNTKNLNSNYSVKIIGKN